jgi:hypothetical protein
MLQRHVDALCMLKLCGGLLHLADRANLVLWILPHRHHFKGNAPNMDQFYISPQEIVALRHQRRSNRQKNKERGTRCSLAQCDDGDLRDVNQGSSISAPDCANVGDCESSPREVLLPQPPSLSQPLQPSQLLCNAHYAPVLHSLYVGHLHTVQTCVVVLIFTCFSCQEARCVQADKQHVKAAKFLPHVVCRCMPL